jgi:deoxyribonuclease V
LAFREGGVIIKAIENIKSLPDLIIFDGHGIAHPRSLGIASHIGVLLDIPTIGCAKEILCGEYKEPGKIKGDFEYIYMSKKKVGVILRTRNYTKPVFVSPGHRVGIIQAKDIVLRCCLKYRIPEPLREAHRLTRIKK